MKLLRDNLKRCKRAFYLRGKNVNYLGEYRYLRGVIHNINLRCLNASNDEIYKLNIIAKETIEKAFSKYIHFDKWTIDKERLLDELFNLSDRYISLKNNQVKYIPKSNLIINNIYKGA